MSTAVPIAIAGRFLLPFLSLHKQLRYHHLLSSPLTSYSRLQEGIFLSQHHIDPYAGGGFHHSPLLLAAFSTVLPLNDTTASLFWASCDALSAYFLVQIWKERRRSNNEGRESKVAGAFLLNPYLLLPSLAFSTSTIENCLFLSSIYFACRKKSSLCLLALALLSQLSLSNTLFLLPLLLLLSKDAHSNLATPQIFKYNTRQALKRAAEYLVYFVCLTFASVIASGGWSWVARTWWTEILLPDLTPNCGLWWYFFTEMFDHFRPFFLMVFNVHLLIYVAPISIKFCHDPLFAIFMLRGIFSIFKSYPTLSDSGLFLSSIALFPEIFPYFRHAIVTTLLHLHASLLLPLFHSLWLSQGTGNANFFYASTLVFGMANGAAVVDCIFAGLRIAFGDVKGLDIVQE